jgi:hypothetical protein
LAAIDASGLPSPRRSNRHQSQNSRDPIESHNMTQTILRVVRVRK